LQEKRGGRRGIFLMFSPERGKKSGTAGKSLLGKKGGGKNQV